MNNIKKKINIFHKNQKPYKNKKLNTFLKNK